MCYKNYMKIKQYSYCLVSQDLATQDMLYQGCNSNLTLHRSRYFKCDLSYPISIWENDCVYVRVSE